MAKGISLIQGNKYPRIGEPTTYSVAAYYPGTVPPQDESSIRWKIYAEQSTGNWRELRGSEKTGRQATFSFPQQWYGKKILVEAYLNNPEIKAPPGLIIMPVPGERKIDSIGFFDSNWNPLQRTPMYGQTLNVRINTVNMLGEELKISLWERDTYSDTGHDPSGNTNVWDSEKTYKVSDPNGRVEFSMPLDLMWRLKADKGIFDVEGSEHEYYLLVKGAGARTKYSRQQNVSDDVDTSAFSTTSPPRTAPTPAPATNRPASPTAPAANPTTPAAPTNNTPAANSPAATPAPVSQQQPVTVGGVGANPPAANGAISPAVVNDVTVEGLIDAYFAKKEYTKKTTDAAGTFEYNVGSNGNRTGTDAEKTNIATAILGKQNVKDLVKEKRYTTLEAIKAGLTQAVYNRNDKVTFETFKLEAEFVKISSAPLETKLYLVAKAYVLEDKQATIIIKEKDGLIKGSADSVLPILEITEAEMEQATPTTGEVPGTEKSEFTGTIKDGLVKIPVHLRPKSADDLKTWRDKLAKGKKDADYTYKFGGTNEIKDEAGKKTVAAAILRNIKNGNAKNTKLADGINAFEDDIIQALEVKIYVADNEISFATYKKQPELLYLNVKATGEKEHNKDFLKAEGAYFEIAKKCPRCNAPVTVEQLKEIFTNASEETIKKVADTYTKYMAELEMNTCWNKAHFFAQAYIESGLGLHVRDGENFNYYYEGLSIFGAFQSEEGRRKARLWGRAVRTPSTPGVSLENQKNIANYAYSPPAAKASELGNTEPNDGWDFRGKGLIQLTGRTAYEQANVYTMREGSDIIANPDLVISDLSVAVLSSMVFFKWKKINKITYGQSDTLPISRKVGKEVGSSYTEKQNAFDQHTKITFKTNQCSDSDDNSTWKNPLASCQRTYYNSSGTHREQNGAFGPVRTNNDGTKKNHQGLDLFAEVNTACFACLDGEVVSYTNEGSAGYGNVLVLKVKGEDLRNAKRTYSHEFTDEVEVGEGFDINSEYLYLRYAHLSSAAITSGLVNAGDTICYTGDSGNALNVPNPHLHFEVAKNALSNGKGLQNRYNPAYFVRLDAIDEPLQTKVKNER